MRAEWVELPNGDMEPQASRLHVTLTAKGVFKINKRTWTRIGQPEAVIIYFDRVNNRVGLKPTHASMKNAYRLGVGENRSGGKQIRAWRLMTEHKIDLPETMEFTDVAVNEDGILILDLRTAVASKRAAGRRLEWATNPNRRTKNPVAVAHGSDN